MSEWWEAAAVSDARGAVLGGLVDQWDDVTGHDLHNIVPHLFPDGDTGSHVLEVGCGVGRLTVPVAATLSGCNVVGVDVSPTMLAKARDYAAARNVTNAHFELVDVGLVRRWYGAAYTMRTLQHLHPARQADYVAEVALLLNAGGRFRFQVVLDVGDPGAFGPRSHPVKPVDVVRWCNDADLDVVDGPSVPDDNPTWLWTTARRRPRR